MSVGFANMPNCTGKRCSLEIKRRRTSLRLPCSGLLGSAGEFVFGAAEEGAHGADDPAGQHHDDYDEDGGERPGDVGMARGQPGQGDAGISSLTASVVVG